ncbi:MAG: pyridoxamine 5'-phosphate oxidase family protein [Streptosporangiaceae bacterium]
MNSELDWPEVAARLAPARNYWLATASADGAPHTAPVWGAVLVGALHMFTARSTVKARNIAANPRVAVHLADPADVLIVHGVATDLGLPAQVPAVLAALEAKYHDPADRVYLPSADPFYDVIYAIRPRSAMTWRLDDFTGSQRRWQA